MEHLNKELERAVHEENLEKVKALLSAGADVNMRVKEWRSQDQETLLHITSSVEIAKELLLGGAFVNANNTYRETPLHHAMTQLKKLELIRELLNHGANVNAINRKGNTPLNQAVKKRSSKNIAVIKELLENGADINISNRERSLYEDHHSSLDNAMGDLECAKLLIKIFLIRNFNKDYKKIIDLSPYSEFRIYSEVSGYLDDCVCEILQMKTDEIKEGLSLYDLVKKSFKKNVLHNNQLSVKLAKIDYSKRYPIYSDIILKPFLERADLLNKLSKIQFYSILEISDQDIKEKKIILDPNSVYNISEYLSNDNLLNLIVAFDSSDKLTFQSVNSLTNLVEPGTSINETPKFSFDCNFPSNDSKRPKLE